MAFKDAPHTRAHHGVVISDQDAGHAEVTKLEAPGPIGKVPRWHQTLDHKINGEKGRGLGLMAALPAGLMHRTRTSAMAPRVPQASVRSAMAVDNGNCQAFMR